jgi:uncharacterized protein (TIGR03437 family)
MVNGVESNTVTVYVDNSSPGIYTLAESGIGPGAILHADYTLVTSSSPAVPGETVLLFMDGLGTVTPQVADGAAGSSSPLSYSDEFDAQYIQVYLDDTVDTTALGAVEFAGLAPGFAGLYQVNFAIPAGGLINGDVYILMYTGEAITEMATISVSGFVQPAARISRGRTPRLQRPVLGDRSAGSHRRALPGGRP